MTEIIDIKNFPDHEVSDSDTLLMTDAKSGYGAGSATVRDFKEKVLKPFVEKLGLYPGRLEYAVLTFDDYEALAKKEANTLYVIKNGNDVQIVYLGSTVLVDGKTVFRLVDNCMQVSFDGGSTHEYVVDENGPRLELTSDGPLVSANLNSSGMLAVTTQISGTKGHVDVYGADMQVLFAFNAHRRFVADACVTEDGGYLAAVTMGQADSVFISNLVIYDLTQEDPVADYSVPDGLVTAMTGRGDRILTVTDTCLAVGNTAGKLLGTYSYNGEYLREYDLGGEDYTVLQLNRYQSGSVGRLVTVDDDGEEIASLDVAEEVRDVSACGRYLSVLYADRLVVYNRQLQAYATLHGPEHTREVLTRADGSVLMIGADSAELFLP